MKIVGEPIVLLHLPRRSLGPYHLMQLQLRLWQLTWPQHKTVRAGWDTPLCLYADWGIDGTLEVDLEAFLAFDDVGQFVGL